MNTTPSPRQVTTEDLLAALLPDSPAGATPTSPIPTPVAQPALDVTALLDLARRQGALEATVTHTTAPAAPEAPAGPLVPRWAIGTAVASVGIGAGGFLLAHALDLLATGAAALAAGITAAAPVLILGIVLLAALLGGRRPTPERTGGTVNIRKAVIKKSSFHN
ncbi:hypothetical protein ACFY1C_24845 [Streptomyces sp. NPDC001279]|uniref:hypothetical protein n=1 Tax=Streptomyces sp. NPDC001279 TaxID=3364556 RepID=UPI003684B77A